MKMVAPLSKEVDLQFHQRIVDTQITQLSLPSSTNRFPFSSFSVSIFPFLDYFCIIVVLLTWITLGIGVWTRKLAGIEAVFVTQCVWIMFVWNSKNPILLFKRLHFLRFINGLNLPFFQEQLNTKNELRVEFFGLSTLFGNNFNIWAVPMVLLTLAFVFTLLRHKTHKQSDKQNSVRTDSKKPMHYTLA